jgi:hypothetical protein
MTGGRINADAGPLEFTPLSTVGLNGQAAMALDPANAGGRSTTDACSPIRNVSEIAGGIAMADRGTCSSVEKARNVQAAGAIGLTVVNNVEGTLPTYPQEPIRPSRFPVVHVRGSGCRLPGTRCMRGLGQQPTGAVRYGCR